MKEKVKKGSLKFLKKLIAVTMIIVLNSSTAVYVNAASLSTTLSVKKNGGKIFSGKSSINIGDNIVATGKVKYDGFFYVGYYYLEMKKQLIDEDISGSFANQVFVSTKSANKKNKNWKGETVYQLSASFFSIANTSKHTKVTCMGSKAGKGGLYCGTGTGHDLDDGKTFYITVNE